LNKINDKGIQEDLPIELAYKMRNIIAHNYIGVNKKVIAQTLQEDIPGLREKISRML